jgi:hypothetical protein
VRLQAGELGSVSPQVMLDTSLLKSRFETYWDDLERCRQSGAFWSLLHVTVCIPDICAALESPDGKTSRSRYITWCARHFTEPLLVGAERYRMRCKVLHQGRATTDEPGRYSRFSFGSPSVNGEKDHLRVEGGTLHLDVGDMASEAQHAVEAWIGGLAAAPASTAGSAVAANLSSMVRVDVVQVRQPRSTGVRVFTINKTN